MTLLCFVLLQAAMWRRSKKFLDACEAICIRELEAKKKELEKPPPPEGGQSPPEEKASAESVAT